MTVSESLVLVLLIALWSTGNGVDLSSNTVILITLLIALIALSKSTSYRCCSGNNSLFTTTNTNGSITTFF